MSSPVLILKPSREKSLLRHHPWIFSGAADTVRGNPTVGETVEVRTAQGEFLAWAAYSPHSQIRARVWSWEEEMVINEGLFRERLARAFRRRESDQLSVISDQLIVVNNQSTDTGSLSASARRLVHGESDGLPGLIIDQYGDTLVMQCLSAGAEYWREALADLALQLTGARRIYERSDADVRLIEGLTVRNGVLRGDEPPDKLLIEEHGLLFYVDVRKGHKTGFYLDQSLNRLAVRQLASGREALDCFCYTGGFTANLLTGGATRVTALDSSAEALRLAQENIALNSLPAEKVEWIEGDAFQKLRSFRDARRSFDLIVLDPPKFAPTTAQVEKAARGYKDVNLLAFKLLRPNGILVTFSCSGGVSEELFQKIVAGAALDVGVEAQIVARLHQAPDHPVSLNFPESAYLKGFICVIHT